MYDAQVRLATEILAQFTDTASARFDDVLASLTIDELHRRELKYWQRQSLASVRQFAAHALPAALSAVATAQQDALDAVAAAESSWAAVTPKPADPAAETPVPEMANRETALAAVLVAQLDAAPPADTHSDPDQPDALELRRRALAARLANGA